MYNNNMHTSSFAWLFRKGSMSVAQFLGISEVNLGNIWMIDE